MSANQSHPPTSPAHQAGVSTQAVHSGPPRRKANHALTTPIYQTATFTFDDTADLLQFLKGEGASGPGGRLEYGRYGNPTVTAAERKMAALERGEDAVLFSSGMSAITSVLLATLSTGAHIVMTADSYRRTRQFCEVYLDRLGIETTIVPMGDYPALEAAIQPGRTRFILSESPTNPYLRVADLEQIAALGRRHGVTTLIDSTFATPVNQQPLAWGIDLVVHSATKYLAGHNDLLAGVVVGSGDLIQTVRDARGIFGNIVDPHNAFLLERGLKTLALRVRQQNATAGAVAHFLEDHPRVQRVWYPGLESHPDHAVASRQMQGFGGVVSFEIAGDLKTTGDFVDALRIPYIAPSLGGVESLVEQPAIIGYYDKSPAERAALGIKDNLIRLAVGIEDTEDIISDLVQALDRF